MKWLVFALLLGAVAYQIQRLEVKEMAVIYVALIVKGKRTYADIPALIKPKVKELLTDLELEDLITEE